MRESLFGCGTHKVEVGHHTNSKKEKVRKIKGKKKEILKEEKREIVNCETR